MATQTVDGMEQNAGDTEFKVVKSRKRKLKPETDVTESSMDTAAPPKKPHFPPISGDKLTVRLFHYFLSFFISKDDMAK